MMIGPWVPTTTAAANGDGQFSDAPPGDQIVVAAPATRASPPRWTRVHERSGGPEAEGGPPIIFSRARGDFDFTGEDFPEELEAAVAFVARSQGVTLNSSSADAAAAIAAADAATGASTPRGATARAPCPLCPLCGQAVPATRQGVDDGDGDIAFAVECGSRSDEAALREQFAAEGYELAEVRFELTEPWQDELRAHALQRALELEGRGLNAERDRLNGGGGGDCLKKATGKTSRTKQQKKKMMKTKRNPIHRPGHCGESGAPNACPSPPTTRQDCGGGGAPKAGSSVAKLEAKLDARFEAVCDKKQDKRLVFWPE